MEEIMIKACLCDLFGILVSDTKCSGGASEEITTSSRNDSTDSLGNLGGLTGLSPEDNRQRVYENARGYFEQSGAQMPDMLLPGALDFIKDLYRHGIRMASTATDCRPEKVLSSVGLYSMFDYIVDPQTVAERPAPEALLKAANNLGIDPEECIAIENTPEGIEAAKAAGMRCLAVGDLTRLYTADMAVPDVRGLTLLRIKDGLEVRPAG